MADSDQKPHERTELETNLGALKGTPFTDRTDRGARHRGSWLARLKTQVCTNKFVEKFETWVSRQIRRIKHSRGIKDIGVRRHFVRGSSW